MIFSLSDTLARGHHTQDIFYFIIAERDRIIKYFGEISHSFTKLSSRFPVSVGKSSAQGKDPTPQGEVLGIRRGDQPS
jgi:hypothetical protein